MSARPLDGCSKGSLIDLSPTRSSEREEFRLRRRSLTVDARTFGQRAAQARLIETAPVQAAPRLALYRAFDGEVDTSLIEAWATETGKDVVYPRQEPGAPLSFLRVKTWSPRARGPDRPEGERVDLEQGDVVVVPGVAFDFEGYRLGLGGGHYDRTLPTCPALAIGLAFEVQRVPRLPREPWDQPVDLLVTELDVYDFLGREIL